MCTVVQYRWYENVPRSSFFRKSLHAIFRSVNFLAGGMTLNGAFLSLAEQRRTTLTLPLFEKFSSSIKVLCDSLLTKNIILDKPANTVENENECNLFCQS